MQNATRVIISRFQELLAMFRVRQSHADLREDIKVSDKGYHILINVTSMSTSIIHRNGIFSFHRSSITSACLPLPSPILAS
jgi:hypothetical protein